MAREATASARLPKPSLAGRLAKFFPEATPVRIPITLTRTARETGTCTENTIIEFGTPREVLFISTIPLEFSEILRLQNSDSSLDVEATVVAVQYHDGQTAVAARFTHEVANWIVKS